jgi:hypothetical protein
MEKINELRSLVAHAKVEGRDENARMWSAQLEEAERLYQAEQDMRALDQAVGQDCPHCPKGDNGYHQYKIKSGCFVKGVPSCEWCAYTEEIWQNYQDGENGVIVEGVCLCGVEGCKGLD